MRRYWPYIALVAAFGCLVASDTVWNMPYYWTVGFAPIFLLSASAVLAVPSALCLIFRLIRPLVRYAIPTTADAHSLFLSILWLAIMAIVLMCLYPPWMLVAGHNNVKVTAPLGYSYLWRPPESDGAIDFSRLLLQCFIVALPAGCLLYMVKVSRNRDLWHKVLRCISVVAVLIATLLAAVFLVHQFYVKPKRAAQAKLNEDVMRQIREALLNEFGDTIIDDALRAKIFAGVDSRQVYSDNSGEAILHRILERDLRAPVIKSQAEYDQFPAGRPYRNAEYEMYIKRKKLHLIPIEQAPEKTKFDFIPDERP